MKRIYVIEGFKTKEIVGEKLFSITELLVLEERLDEFVLEHPNSKEKFVVNKNHIEDFYRDSAVYTNIYSGQIIYTSSITVAEEYLKLFWQMSTFALNLRESLCLKLKKYIGSRNYQKAFENFKNSINEFFNSLRDYDNIVFDVVFSYNHYNSNKKFLFKVNMIGQHYGSSELKMLNQLNRDDLDIVDSLDSVNSYGDTIVSFKFLGNSLDAETVLSDMEKIIDIFEDEIKKIVWIYDFKRDLLNKPFSFDYVQENYLN